MNRIARFFEKELRESGKYDCVSGLNAYVGDIHNHCGISYGYGTIENAVTFASQQLDFFSVTGHFAWPDMADDPEMMVPEDVQAYHREGFKKLRRNWPHYMSVMDAAQSPSFIPFYSYEYHGFTTGDYTILCRDLGEELPPEVPEGEKDDRLNELLRGSEEQQERFLCTPHHIGYRKGYRGINWDRYNPAVSPVVEIISMHGCAESFEARQKYLHTMGPRSGENTYQGGLGRGYHFGVVGSTDHHNAAPGSYGYGRTVLFAEKLSRESVWNGLRHRMTSAASGDPIEAMLFVNGTRAGEIVPDHDGHLEIESYVSAYDALDTVEIIQDGKVIASQHDFPSHGGRRGTLSFMFGWGKKHKSAEWDITMKVVNGTLTATSPRLRGIDMVDPLDVPEDGSKMLPSYKAEDNGVKLHVFTNGNATAVTDGTQGFAVEIDGSDDTVISLSVDVRWDGREVHRDYEIPLTELDGREFTDYVSGFVSPSFEIGQFREIGTTLSHIRATVSTENRGAVYLRCYQKNGDSLFTSPVSFSKEGR